MIDDTSSTSYFTNRRLGTHKSTITAVRCSPDGELAVSASADKIVNVYPIGKSDEPTIELRGHRKGINDVCWLHTSGCAHIIASSSEDKTIKIWDANEGKLIRTVEDPDISYCMCMHSQQNIMITGTVSERIKLWDFRIASPVISNIHAHNDIISSINCSPDGADFCTSSFDGCVRIWDVGSGLCTRTICTKDGTAIGQASYVFIKQNLLLLSLLNSTHELWSTNDEYSNESAAQKGPLKRFTGHVNLHMSVGAFIPDSNGKADLLISGSESSEMIIWRIKSEQILARVLVGDIGPLDQPTTLACRPNSANCVISGGGNGFSVQEWEIPELH